MQGSLAVMRGRGPGTGREGGTQEGGCRAARSPILLVWLLLQAGEQADEAVLVLVQGA